jgi:SNF2 family DNA or RNA helicase
VREYQEGKYQVLFAHPQSAGHGLTLTRGTATIWASPTYNLEHFLQGLKRVHRIGQTEKTETIVVVAEGTLDEVVWDALQNKSVKMTELLEGLM